MATCEWCGSTFKPKRPERNRFCDRSCVARAREQVRRDSPSPAVPMTTCGCGCGNEMPVTDPHGRTRRYLYRHNPRSRPIRTCRQCGAEFQHRGASDFCSRPCSNRSRINGNRLERTGALYRQWRQAVLKRDEHTCRGCGKAGGRLHAHHVQEFAAHPDLRLDVDNGLTLCPSCHSWVHQRRLEPGVDLATHTPHLLLAEQLTRPRAPR